MFINCVPVSQQVFWGRIPRTRFYELPSRPRNRRVHGYIEVNDFSIFMPEDYEHIDDIECGRWYNEEVDGKTVVHMVLKKGSPCLGRWLSQSVLSMIPIRTE